MKTEKPRIIFMPGDFDDFTGTQEELDTLIRIITAKAAAGTLQDNYDPDDSGDEIYTEKEIKEIARQRQIARNRTLH